MRLGALAPLVFAALALPVLLRLPRALVVDVGPGDRGYVQGLASEWRLDGDGDTWREMTRRARLRLPVTLEGPGHVTLRLAQPGPERVRLQVSFDDGTERELTLPPFEELRDVSFELPERRVRADVRLRTEGPRGEPGRLLLAEARFEGRGVRPERALFLEWLVLVASTSLALLASGLGRSWALGGALLLVPAFGALAAGSPFALVHLASVLAVVAVFGLATVLVGRLVLRASSPGLHALVYAAVLLKCGLLFHPSFFFYDLPIHETLLELVYHRGVVDFWTNLPAYQVQHNLGLSRVGGAYYPYPYPTLFYDVAHLGNRFFHAPRLWLKLTFGLFSALPIYPVGYLARKLGGRDRADLYAGVAYLFAPAYLLALLILGFSSIAGHFFDLLVVAFLAKVALEIDRLSRAAATAGLVALSLAAYTSGFISMGLLFGSLLALAVPLGGLSRGSAVRLGAAGLLGAALAVATYHPDTVRNLALAVVPQGVEAPAEGPIPGGNVFDAATGRAHLFLGEPLLLAGVFGTGLLLFRARGAPLRLLVGAWVLSGAVAYALRYVFPELLLHEKEMYWIAALLSVGAGVLAARLRRPWGLLVLAAIGALTLLRFVRMVPLYYEVYRFL